MKVSVILSHFQLESLLYMFLILSHFQLPLCCTWHNFVAAKKIYRKKRKLYEQLWQIPQYSLAYMKVQKTKLSEE